jgi:hypothetical protein
MVNAPRVDPRDVLPGKASWWVANRARTHVGADDDGRQRQSRHRLEAMSVGPRPGERSCGELGSLTTPTGCCGTRERDGRRLAHWRGRSSVVSHGSQLERVLAFFLLAFLLMAGLVGPWLGPATAHGTIETQKGAPPAPPPLAPGSAPPPAGTSERPAIEPAPGTPALAPSPGTVNDRGQPIQGEKRIFGLSPAILIGLSALVLVILAASAIYRRTRAI